MVDIAILIASRGRPFRLQIAIHRILKTAANPDRIKIGIWSDDDDPETAIAASAFDNVLLMVGPRPRALSEAQNSLAGIMEADIYTVLADDVYPATIGWDLVIDRLAQTGHPVWAWNHGADDPAYPIMTRQWFEAAGGIFTARRFPFWFDDFWLAEVAEMVTGEPVSYPVNMRLTGDKGKTPRMRDLPFWYRYFHATRPLRVAEAHAIHKMMTGEEMPDRSAIIASLAAGDAIREAKAGGWQDKYSSATGEPDPAYVLAKQAAEDEMALLIEEYGLSA